jgi:hypothetical protein
MLIAPLSIPNSSRRRPEKIHSVRPATLLVDAHYAWPTHVLENWSWYPREARLLAAKWLALDADLRWEEEELPDVDGPSVLPVAADPVLHVQAVMAETPVANTRANFLEKQSSRRVSVST